MHPLNLALPTDRQNLVLLLGAHSDDIEIGCGGTILRLLHEFPSTSVAYVVFSGNQTRAAEARNGFEAFVPVGNRLEFTAAGFRDGFFPYCAVEIKEYFEELKSRLSPQIVFTHFRLDRHQDHRLISDLTWQTFRNHMVLEYEIPKFDGDFNSPNFFVELSCATIDAKLTYLMDCFASQHGHEWFDKSTFSGLARLRGMECNASDGYAEAFYCRKLLV